MITFIAVLIVVCSGNFNALIELELNSGDIVMIFACTLYAIYAVGLRKKPKLGALPLLTFFAYVAFAGSLPGLIYETFSNQLILPGLKGCIILGVIIIFPSFLMHSVNSGQVGTTVSGNIYMKYLSPDSEGTLRMQREEQQNG